MSSLRSQSPLEHPQMPSLGYRILEKEIEVRGSSLPKPHGPQKTPHGSAPGFKSQDQSPLLHHF